MRCLRIIAIGVAMLAFAAAAAQATTTTYQYKDNNGSTFNVQMFQCVSGPIYCTAMMFEDSAGAEKFVSGNPGIVGGAASNASSGVSTGSANVPAIGYLYGFNGTTWDQLQVDGSKYLKINCVTGCGSISWSNSNKVIAWDGTNNTTVKAASTGAAQTDTALVVRNPDVGTVGSSASCSAGSSSTQMECWYALYAAIQNGVGATGSGVPDDALYEAGNAQSSEPSAATTGYLTGAFFDLVGKRVTSPYANRENMVRGAGSGSSTSAITMLDAQGSGVKIYATDLTITRNDAGTSAISVTLNDTASTVIDIPNNGGGGGFSHTYNVPLAFAANTAATCTASSGVTTLHCSLAGFKGY